MVRYDKNGRATAVIFRTNCTHSQPDRKTKINPPLALDLANLGVRLSLVNLLQGHGNALLTRHVDLLRESVRVVRQRHPFQIHGWVVLPDHLHCVIELPPGDADFATRWRLIKMGFSKALPVGEALSAARARRGERDIWQRRFWEHLIRDEADFRAHMDYVHINPVKHGLVGRVVDWPFSTFHALVASEVYPADWAGGEEMALGGGE